MSNVHLFRNWTVFLATYALVWQLMPCSGNCCVGFCRLHTAWRWRCEYIAWRWRWEHVAWRVQNTSDRDNLEAQGLRRHDNLPARTVAESNLRVCKMSTMFKMRKDIVSPPHWCIVAMYDKTLAQMVNFGMTIIFFGTPACRYYMALARWWRNCTCVRWWRWGTMTDTWGWINRWGIGHAFGDD